MQQRADPEELAIHHLDGGVAEHHPAAEGKVLAQLLSGQILGESGIQDRHLIQIDRSHQVGKLGLFHLADHAPVAAGIENAGREERRQDQPQRQKGIDHIEDLAQAPDCQQRSQADHQGDDPVQKADMQHRKHKVKHKTQQQDSQHYGRQCLDPELGKLDHDRFWRLLLKHGNLPELSFVFILYQMAADLSSRNRCPPPIQNGKKWTRLEDRSYPCGYRGATARSNTP